MKISLKSPVFSLIHSGPHRMSCMVRFLFACALLVIVVGCASSGTVTNISAASTGVPISRDIAIVEATSALTDVEPQKSLLNALVISGLQQTQRFGRVSGNQIAIKPTSGIKVSADIKQVNAVSDVARVMVGAFAGQAQIVVQVTVSDLKSGNQIGTFEAEGKSSAGTAFAGTTDQAVQRVAEQIVAEVVKISTQASRT
jgi:Domain of unknown function (DUF4410)